MISTGGRGQRQTMTDLNRSGSFYIRNNLKAALLRFRDPHDDVNVWVDAICIDQENNIEKKAQVSRMHEVYTQAENVCIWLGEGKEETPETFAFLREILDLHNFDELVAEPKATASKWGLIIDLMSNRWFSRRWVIQELALARKASVLWGEEELEWSNFADAIALFMTKYEEIKRTSLDPFCGHHRDVDARALGAYTIVHATTNLFRKSQEGRVKQRLLPLEILVSSLLLAFEASEPRDTIFAVLTLAKDSRFAEENTNVPVIVEDSRISPDYDKTLFDVYADFMHYCIEKSQSLDILCRYWAPLPKQLTPEQVLALGNSGRDKEEMPTWVPFISHSAFGEPHGVLGGRVNGDSFVGGPERKGQQTYNASNNLRAWYKFGTYEPDPSTNLARRSTFPVNFRRQGSFSSTKAGERPNLSQIQENENHSKSDGAMKDLAAARGPSFPSPEKYDGTLSVRGFCLDQVHEVSGRVMGKGIIPAEALRMGGWPHPPPKVQEVPDQLWRTLVADRGPNGTSAPGWYRRTCLECLQHTDRVGDLDIEALMKSRPSRPTPSTMITFLERAQQIVWGRRFFRTKGNKTKNKEPLFCLGSPDVREGDMVCIIFGCSVPVVLRKVSTGGGNAHFEVIGECYVHGMMDGEALEGRKPMFPYGGKKSWVSTFKLK
jgi:hypothetical protein